MARIRTVKPEFWTAEQVMELSPMARLLFIGMWNFCDDRGVHPVAYKTLKAEVFPADDLLSSDVERLIAEIMAQGLLSEFEADNRRWWFVTGWHHQVINRPSKSRYPVPPRNAPLLTAAGSDYCDDDSDNAAETGACDTLTEHSRSTHGALTDGREEEGKGREGSKPPTPPTAREGEFPMDLSWEPSDHFPTLARQAGAPAPTAEAVAEFRSYWIGQGAAMSQHQWDHKLLTNLKAQKLRGGHAPPGRANARASPGQPRTLSEGRAAAAKAIFNPGPAGQDDGHERRTIDVTPTPTAGLGAKALR